MRLSLSILADWLKKYKPACSILSGERTIRNVRLLSDGHRLTDNNVYISRTGGDSGWVICMHKNDYILLNTEDEKQVMNEIMDAFDYYNDWSDTLNRELSSMSLEQVLEHSAGVFDTMLTLTDASYSILAHYCPPGKRDVLLQTIWERGIMEMDQIMNVELDPRIREHRKHCYLQETGGFHIQACVRNLFTGGHHWGWLVSAATTHTKGQMDVQEELGDILEHWMQLHQEKQVQWEQRGIFLSILDGSYSSRENALFQLGLIGWQEQEPKWVYVVNDPHKAMALLHKVTQLSSGVQALLYQEKVVAVFHGSAMERQRFQNGLEHLLARSECRCGISPVFTDFFTLQEQYMLACAASQYGDATLCPFEEFAMDHAMALLKKYTVSWFRHPALDILRKYDFDNHTCFYDTLMQYLYQERSLAQTASIMELHRNTLLYRISRIQEITELNLNDPKLRLHLMLSFALENLKH